ncbi:MAG: hypothetical protein JSW71_04040 [Gemmatimonadota bacterium]|nr:MAG: hypothetical protein JSW71_04040 [Gemmatimonadota bacterium]
MRNQAAAVLLAAALLALRSPVVVAQQPLSHERVQQDVRLFVSTLEETHPDPYTAFGGKVEFKRRVRELLTNIPADGLDAAGIHELLAAFLADLGDGHTQLSSPAVSEQSALPKFLPLRFAVATDAVFVSQAAMGLDGLVGHRLLAAEGLQLEELSALAGKILPAENAYGRARIVARAIRSTRHSVRLFGRQLDGVRLLLQSPEGSEASWRVGYMEQSVLSEVEWSGDSRIELEVGDSPIWWSYLHPERVGYLRLESIEGAEAFWEARDRKDLPGYVTRYYRRYFGREAPTDLDSALAGIPCFTKTVTDVLGAMRTDAGEYLIVDVRGNGGGWSTLMRPLYLLAFGAEYLDYPFPDLWVDVASPQLMEMNGWTRQDLGSEWGPGYEVGDYRFEVAGRPRGDRSLAEYVEGLRVYRCGLAEAVESLAGEPIHRPTVIVLMDSGTLSAAYHLAYRLWRLGAVLVGVASAQAGNAYTNVVRVELPNSGLVGTVARSAQIFFPSDEALGRVLEPDFPITWSDLARYDFDQNSELLYALELIASGQIPRRAARVP